jgi:hypothetical protein
MSTERFNRRRVTALALVGLAVMVRASTVHAQEKPPSSEPPSWPPAYNSPPPQGAAGAPAPVWPDQQPTGGYPPSQGDYRQQQGSQGSPPPAGYVRLPPPNVHDGFYLRLHVGFGSTSLEGKDGVGNQNTFSGAGLSFGVALGGTVAPNLVVFGTFLSSIAEEPTISSGQGPSFASDGSAGLFGVGAGVAYYVQPLNLYLSGAIAGLQVDISDANANSVYESKFGFGFQGIVGKEWWVSPEWGLGIALEAVVAGGMKDKNDSSLTWSGHAVNLLFSATYN